MAANKNQPRRKKADWLETALAVLETEGAGGVRVERLARKLTVAKTGFYCHFKGRQDLLDQRLSFARSIFRELGFTGAELKMRTYLWVGYHAWERTAFPQMSRSLAKRLIKRRVAFFVRP